MTEMLDVKVMGTEQELKVPAVEPVESARLFWGISDGLWSTRRPEESALSSYGRTSVKPTLEARDMLNEVLGDIDEGLVVSGAGKALKLGERHWRDDKEGAELSSEILATPLSATIGTFNWDVNNTFRYADVEGKKTAVQFLDGHNDRYRELFATFHFRDGDHDVALTYSTQRMEQYQDQAVSLNMKVWHSDYAESGYEGEGQKHVPMTVEQELKVLGVFHAMSGVELEESKA